MEAQKKTMQKSYIYVYRSPFVVVVGVLYKKFFFLPKLPFLSDSLLCLNIKYSVFPSIRLTLFIVYPTSLQRKKYEFFFYIQPDMVAYCHDKFNYSKNRCTTLYNVRNFMINLL